MKPSYQADFGSTAHDYARHRAGFPDRFFDELAGRNVGLPGQTVLDLGTGTGTLARGFARRGATVTGVDIAPDMLVQAREIADSEGLKNIIFQTGSAEDTGMPANHFDIATAGQCWHWFDGPKAFGEVLRILKPGGQLVICHFDWLPLAGNVVAATERLILNHAPNWPYGGGTGIYPAWTTGMAEAGFEGVETFSFTHIENYNKESWRGRIRASAPIGGSMDAAGVAAFDADHAALLDREFPDDPLPVPHRCWAAIGQKPG